MLFFYKLDLPKLRFLSDLSRSLDCDLLPPVFH